MLIMLLTSLKQTPLIQSHIQLGAKLVEFGGWEMPVSYTTLIDEHTTTRTKAGLFDICHMGEFFISGPDAYDFLQFVLTNDLDRLSDGMCCYSALCYANGGTIDDLFVYRFSATRWMLVVNAGTIEKDLAHLISYSKNFQVNIEDYSQKFGKLDLQGPLAESILKQVSDIQGLKRFRFIENQIFQKKVIISRTGYTGEDGFELYVDSQDVVAVWEQLLAIGQPFGLKPIGLGARDTLRLEACYSLYGHELTDEITPVEAGIGFVVREKMVPYIGKKNLIEQKKNGTVKQLICFTMADKSIPRDHYEIYQAGKSIGIVSSGTFSPTLHIGIGMGFVSTSLSFHDQIDIMIRGTLHPAVVGKRPFYASENLRT